MKPTSFLQCVHYFFFLCENGSLPLLTLLNNFYHLMSPHCSAIVCISAFHLAPHKFYFYLLHSTIRSCQCNCIDIEYSDKAYVCCMVVQCLESLYTALFTFYYLIFSVLSKEKFVSFINNPHFMPVNIKFSRIQFY